MEIRLDVEILVHIGAPSRVADDTRYRSLATAYLEFEPNRTTCLPSRQSEHLDGNVGDDGRPSSEPYQSNQDGESSIWDDARVATLHSPQASFGSVLDNADSPRIRTGQARGGVTTPLQASTQTSWQTPPSVVQDSCPMNLTGLAALTSPTRVLENYLQHFASPSRTSEATSPASTRKGASRDTICSPQYTTPGRNQISSSPQVIPCTTRIKKKMNLSDNQVSQNASQPQNVPSKAPSDNEIIEETVLISSSHPSVASRADSEPPPKVPVLPSSPRALARASSDLGPRLSSSQKIPVTISFLGSHGFTFDSLEIRSPEPPTDDVCVEPEHLVTPGLQKLANDIDLSNNFRPTRQTRDLRPFERGYWLLDCSTWEPQLKRNAWAFLANYVGTGTAGWGVWCKRDDTFEELRVYCWGFVAAHVYYLLWLSSQRSVRYTGCSYVDADGQNVIVMAARQITGDQRG
ncbi:hypothetical protein F5Y16DRAFT_50779 [Xylariaceae sp. FL0255]|nr:hypothetical protein F5Y16DRAFT_50779 [Xylariaceae sp. FL0255]